MALSLIEHLNIAQILRTAIDRYIVMICVHNAGYKTPAPWGESYPALTETGSGALD